MSQTPDTTPEISPEMVADTVQRVWHAFADARETDDGVHEVLVVYPSEDPRETITIQPTYGNTEIDHGFVHVGHAIGRKTPAAYLLFMSKEKGNSFIGVNDSRGIPGAFNPATVSSDKMRGLWSGLAESSPVRPPKKPGRIARALGRSAQG